MIERKTIEGKGSGTADATGYKYGTIKIDGGFYARGSLKIKTSYPNTVNWTSLYTNNDRIPADCVLEITDSFAGMPYESSWKITLQKTYPALNQTELTITQGETGLIFQGDDDVCYRGQAEDPATVDISGLPLQLETLAKLYQRALYERSADDPTGAKIAAKYLKLKNAIIAGWHN